jgi:hypothetical protein
MANLRNHLDQAEHNKSFAAQLDADPALSHWDWLITVAFYAAVHYVEALFFLDPDIGHTEEACPDGLSEHAYRAGKVKDLLGKDCWKSYRNLQNASYNVRYLGLAQKQPANIAVDYYSCDDAKRMYSVHLSIVRNAVQAELRK